MSKLGKLLSTEDLGFRVIFDKYELVYRLQKTTTIYFIMCDIRLFQLDVENPYKYMTRVENPVPMIMYNDPYPEPKDRASYWTNKNFSYFNGKIDNLEKYEGSFMLIQELLEQEEFAENIYGVKQPAAYVSPENWLYVQGFDRYCTIHNLSPILKFLLRLLLNSRDYTATLQEMCLLLWHNDTLPKQNQMYGHIKKLGERLMTEKEEYSLYLCHEGKSLYSLKIKKNKI